MITAKLFKHGGSQAVRLPKAFRFAASEVFIEKQGGDVVLRPIPSPPFRTFTDIARHLEEQFHAASDFPAPPPRPAGHERAAPGF